uniref:Uncharacterized protein n=1 Tax=Trichuris muris TaxID=70415 RepID=A0A5S6QHC9_TRIMR
MRLLVTAVAALLVITVITVDAVTSHSREVRADKRKELMRRKNMCIADEECVPLAKEFREEKNSKEIPVKRERYLSCVNSCKTKVDNQLALLNKK